MDVARGSIGTVRGAIVKVLTGGHNISDPRFAVRAPLELHIPMRMRLNGELGTALYSILLDESADGDLAKRIGTAIRWLAKSWRNTVSLGAEDQVVMIRTALEALTGTSKTRRAIAWLEQTFDALRQHGAHDARFTEHLLWSPDERPTREITLPGRDGKPETHAVTDLGHWFSTFGHARHQIVHEGVVPQLTYELDGSRYNGPLFHTGERLTREAIKASLIRFGYSDLWQQEIFRALKRTIQRSGLAERLAQEPSG
ncbi:MAG TPA: hypothetical protein VND96_18900 [Candidatus Micrarchaeaceae archaeon]|nr:hypothetical protein [Candidatus Micrarchaeaceae archaeon]